MRPRIKKPDWLKVKLGGNEKFSETKMIVDSHSLHTICQSGRCPNIGECWQRGTATFMIAGDICTRSCRFCNTKTGKPLPLDEDEPRKVAESIQLMQLKYAVVTSVDRDDLSDYGVSHWAATIRQIKFLNPDLKLEVLIPDFRGEESLVEMICNCSPDIISHNMETVYRLTPVIRSAARYNTSLNVLKYITEKGCTAKSGIMLGLGETLDEVRKLMDDLLSVGCRSLTIGQYLQPTRKHFPVAAYISPDVFSMLKDEGLNKGFYHIESGPLVRSSYHAENIFY